ncbi:MAG: hypothetical protein VW804_03125, partial [Verrucomicrobiota bacterium]
LGRMKRLSLGSSLSREDLGCLGATMTFLNLPCPSPALGLLPLESDGMGEPDCLGWVDAIG